MNPLDHNASLNRLRSGNRPDRGGNPTAGFVAQQRLVKQVRAAFEKMTEVQLAMFWLNEDFSALSREDRSPEHVFFRLEQYAMIDNLVWLWEHNCDLHELVAHVLGARNAPARRAPGGGPLLGNDDE